VQTGGINVDVKVFSFGKVYIRWDENQNPGSHYRAAETVSSGLVHSFSKGEDQYDVYDEIVVDFPIGGAVRLAVQVLGMNRSG
jgi:hypothetical protein